MNAEQVQAQAYNELCQMVMDATGCDSKEAREKVQKIMENMLVALDAQ